MTVTSVSATRVCAGYFVGHPAASQPSSNPLPEAALALLAALGEQGRAQVSPATGPAFVDLDSAREYAELLDTGRAVHAIWLAQHDADLLVREESGSVLAQLLGQIERHRPGQLTAKGHDVLGVSSELVLSWITEDIGYELCRELELTAAPPPFLPDRQCAEDLVERLENDDLAAPVLWIPCWRTIHSTS